MGRVVKYGIKKRIFDFCANIVEYRKWSLDGREIGRRASRKGGSRESIPKASPSSPASLSLLSRPPHLRGAPTTAQRANVATGTAAANATAAAGRSRPGSLDMILLLDKSLSMAPFFGKVKEYAAGEVLGPILMPGRPPDRRAGLRQSPATDLDHASARRRTRPRPSAPSARSRPTGILPISARPWTRPSGTWTSLASPTGLNTCSSSPTSGRKRPKGSPYQATITSSSTLLSSI